MRSPQNLVTDDRMGTKAGGKNNSPSNQQHSGDQSGKLFQNATRDDLVLGAKMVPTIAQDGHPTTWSFSSTQPSFNTAQPINNLLASHQADNPNVINATHENHTQTDFLA